MRQIILAAVVATLLTVVPTGSPVQVSASTGRQQTSSSATQHEHPQATGQSGAQDMKKMHQQMMAEMKAADAKLDQLVQQMNEASGDAKVNATAAVVTELVRQQKAMHEHMGTMHEHMMGGMMMKR